MSEVVGGPVGRHARPHSWWTPLRVLLALSAVVMSLAIARGQPCLASDWSGDEARYALMCYSDIPYLYTGRGLAEGRWPYDSETAGRWQVMEYPVGISYAAYAVAQLTLATPLTRAGPPVEQRRAAAADRVYALPGIADEVNTYYLLTAILLTGCLLGATWFLARTHRRRPWDALPFVLAPTLLASALVNWDLLAVVCVAGALWAWSRDRPVLTGVLLGVGTAMKLYPLFLLGPVLLIAWRRRRVRDAVGAAGGSAAAWTLLQVPAWLTGPEQWRVFWSFNESRGADWGSLWLLAQNLGRGASAVTINTWSAGLLAVACAAIAVLALRAPRTPTLAQLGFLVVAAFLLVNKVYSPQYVLWLLPLAVLAVPRWRPLLVWQAGELLYFAAIWWNLGGWLAGANGTGSPFYDMAIVVRVAAQAYLVVVVVRDVLRGRSGSGDEDPVDVGGGEPHSHVDLVAHGRHG